MTMRERMKAAAQVASGNMLEMYDFMVFGYYAAAIGRAFFPSTDPYAELMMSFATFGAGFLMRPLGALLLGAYVDRIGRRKGLILTLTLMSIGTLTLTLTPGYAAIGILAPCWCCADDYCKGFPPGWNWARPPSIWRKLHSHITGALLLRFSPPPSRLPSWRRQPLG